MNNQSYSIAARSPQSKFGKNTIAPQVRSITLDLTEKAYAAIKAEALARSVTPERLTLAALLDYLGRGGKTPGAKASPLVLAFPWVVRTRVVEAAHARGLTINQFMIIAASAAISDAHEATTSPGEARALVGRAIAACGERQSDAP